MDNSTVHPTERELHRTRPLAERLRLRVAFLLRFAWHWLAAGGLLLWWGVTTRIERSTTQLPAGVEAAFPPAPTWLPGLIALIGAACLVVAWRTSSSWLFAGDAEKSKESTPT